MEVREFVGVCLILIAMIAVAVFVINIAWNLAELIISAFVVIITVIGSAVLFVGSVVIGIFSWAVLGIVSVIVGLIIYFKGKLRKDKK